MTPYSTLHNAIKCKKVVHDMTFFNQQSKQQPISETPTHQMIQQAKNFITSDTININSTQIIH